MTTQSARDKVSGNERLLVGLVLLTAVLIRVVYLLYYFSEVPYATAPIVDSALYDQWARRVAAGLGYGPRPYYMAPLYPTLLGLLYAVTGHSQKLVILLQSALGVLNIYLVYRIGRRVFSPIAGLIAMLLMMLYAPMMFLETKILTETLAITINLGVILLLFHAFDRPGKWRFLLAGIAVGTAVLVRSNTLVFVALYLAWEVWRLVRGVSKRRLSHLGLVVAGGVLVILPVTIRNAVTGHDLALITTNAGIVFAQSNHANATGIATKLPGFSGEIQKQQQEEMAIASKALGHRVTPSESSAYWFKQGLKFITGHPLDFLGLLGRKFLWSIHNREARDVYNLDYEKLRIPILGMLALPFWLLAGFAFFGFLQSRGQEKTSEKNLLALFVLSVYLTLWIFAVSFRYRAPAAPVLAVFAGYGVVRWARALRDRNWRGLGIHLACLAPFVMVSLVPYPIAKITAEAPTNLGAAFLKQGKPARAVHCLQQAVKMDPAFANAHYNLGLALQRLGATDAAIREFRKTVRLQPGNAQAHHNLGMLLDRKGRTIQAIHQYRAAIRLDPNQPQPHCNLAIALYEHREFKAAQHEVTECKRLGLAPDPAFLKALAKKIERNQ